MTPLESVNSPISRSDCSHPAPVAAFAKSKVLVLRSSFRGTLEYDVRKMLASLIDQRSSFTKVCLCFHQRQSPEKRDLRIKCLDYTFHLVNDVDRHSIDLIKEDNIGELDLIHQPEIESVSLKLIGIVYLFEACTHKSVMFLSSCGSTFSPSRSVKKSVVSKSPMKVVQSTTETQVSSLATLDSPPSLIS